MPILVKDIRLALDDDEASLGGILARKLGVPLDALVSFRVVRISLDARKKADIRFVYTVLLSLRDAALEATLLKRGMPNVFPAPAVQSEALSIGTKPASGRIAVIGAGPAGLFAAYTLAKNGYAPLLIERGKPALQRAADVERFFAGGALNPQSNIMFGEGGAGAFSDGKLTTRIKDPRAGAVLDILASHGAPEDICIQAKPHLGTDVLTGVVSNIRKSIERYGGETRFETTLTGFRFDDGRLTHITLQHNGVEEHIECAACVLAIGQGARDTYRALKDAGFELTPKPFAVGVRIEHRQEEINRAQYGKAFEHPRLGAAEYRVASRHCGRGVYSFCMCPGGYVIASSSAYGEVVTNGMSRHSRNGVNANAALVVAVSPDDYGYGSLDGMRFQEALEHAAFAMAGGDYAAPVQCAGDFVLHRRTRRFGSVTPTYLPGVTPSDLNELLPEYVCSALKAGLRDFGRQLRGFDAHDAVLTAVETRTSAPLRIVRNEPGEATRYGGVYPAGEGAGYAGGIVSAAVDGINAAEQIMRIYAPILPREA
ncbi:MAG: FAD-dependent oxidoreductase [Clostridia bacterium]|nr:FAD-dependent oxidoreductase [Clostridia bacterium]